jgi:formate dehydrogenase alpha subunit
VQDIFLTESAKLATVVLPAASAAEKSGSFTSVDNRVQCFNRAVAPAGQSRSDSDILVQLFGLLAPATAVSGQAVEKLHHEITSLTGLYTETCDHEGCRMGRVKNRVYSKDKPATFAALLPAGVAAADPAYPFRLTVGPILHHNGSMTLWSDNNMLVAEHGYLEINPADAVKSSFAENILIRITSALGSTILSVRLSDRVQPGALFAPSHFRESQAGLLLKDSANTVAVKLEKA